MKYASYESCIQSLVHLVFVSEFLNLAVIELHRAAQILLKGSRRKTSILQYGYVLLGFSYLGSVLGLQYGGFRYVTVDFYSEMQLQLLYVAAFLAGVHLLLNAGIID